MIVNKKTVIVTGGASGIGAAIARRFADGGANLVIGDLDGGKADQLASSFGGAGMRCDVTVEADIQALVAFAEERFGPVDMFVSNAGIVFGEGDHAASASNEVWQTCWDVHVMAHVYAARAVLPSMIERGEGYLLQMASAAGLLSQIGDAAYSATKHAAVAFAESLAITHGEQGVRVSVICPQYVATPMLGYKDENPTPAGEGVITPEKVADAVIAGVENESFLILPHPEVAQFMQLKSADYERWLGGMRKLRRNIIDAVGSTDLQAMHKLM